MAKGMDGRRAAVAFLPGSLYGRAPDMLTERQLDGLEGQAVCMKAEVAAFDPRRLPRFLLLTRKVQHMHKSVHLAGQSVANPLLERGIIIGL